MRERERAPAGGGKSRSLSLTRAKQRETRSTGSLTLVARFRRALLAVFARTVQSIPSSLFPTTTLRSPPFPGYSQRPSRLSPVGQARPTLDTRARLAASPPGRRTRIHSSRISQKAPVRLAACTRDCLESRVDALTFRVDRSTLAKPPLRPLCRIATGAPCASRNRVVQTLERVTTSSRASPGTEWRRRQMDPQRTTAAAAIMRPLTASRGQPLRPRRRVDLRNRSRGEKAAGLLVENPAHDTTTIARNRPWSVRGGWERRSERAHPVRGSCVCVDFRCRLTSVGLDYAGRVKLAKHKVTGQYAAVKIVPKPRKKDQDRANKVRSQQRDLPPSKRRVC